MSGVIAKRIEPMHADVREIPVAGLQEPLHYFEIEPEDSKFYTVGVDVTHRCNMACANCYSPIRDLPDVPKEDLLRFFSRLGQRTEIRLTGGEPTLRTDLPELFRAIVELGHRASLMTNGLKLADKTYTAELKATGLKFVALSVNGADRDDVYKKLDGQACADKKMRALDNLAELGFFLNLNCILAKGINDDAPARLRDKLKELGSHGTLRFRNIGKLGRHMTCDNWTFDEMIDLVTDAFGVDRRLAEESKLVNGYEEEHNVLFPVDPKRKYSTTWIKITDWRPSENSIPDPNSIRRGRMTKDFKVAPFFEHAKINGW
jgi:molybdenum cofactor biosynthesis enzyme MoaA